MSDFLGRHVWYELMTADVEGAVAFYTRVAGYTASKWEGGFEYTMLANDKGAFCGVASVAQQEGQGGSPPMWVGYVGTPDADATAARVRELGGSVVEGPMDVPGVGRMYILRDPQGALFAIHQPSGAEGMAPNPAIGWHELVTTDAAAAGPFYAAVFGWVDGGSNDMGPMGIYQRFGLAGGEIGGRFTLSGGMRGPARWTYYLTVPDARTAAAEVEAAGGKVLGPPHTVPGGGMIAQCLDPQGAEFALFSPG